MGFLNEGDLSKRAEDTLAVPGAVRSCKARQSRVERSSNHSSPTLAARSRASVISSIGSAAVLLLLLLTGCAAPRPQSPHEILSISTRGEIASEGSWISDWITPAGPFDELLPSWNIALPDSASVRVDVAVSESLEGPSSPWLDVGGWGAWPESQRSATEFENGRVSIDILKLTRPMQRARLRLRFRELQLAQQPKIERLTLCFTDGARAESSAFGPHPSEAFHIEVPQRRQTDEGPDLAPRICSPTSVAMLLAHHGVSVSTESVAHTLYDSEHDIYGNWNRAIQGAFLLGVPGQLIRVQSWGEALAWMGRERPLIISIGVRPGQLTSAPYPSTAGHLLVLCGFDGAGNALVMDPAVPAGESGFRSYKLEELEQVWLRRGGYAYLISPLVDESDLP